MHMQTKIIQKHVIVILVIVIVVVLVVVVVFVERKQTNKLKVEILYPTTCSKARANFDSNPKNKARLR